MKPRLLLGILLCAVPSTAHADWTTPTGTSGSSDLQYQLQRHAILQAQLLRLQRIDRVSFFPEPSAARPPSTVSSSGFNPAFVMTLAASAEDRKRSSATAEFGVL